MREYVCLLYGFCIFFLKRHVAYIIDINKVDMIFQVNLKKKIYALIVMPKLHAFNAFLVFYLSLYYFFLDTNVKGQ